jgi:hypothetical protein
MSLFTNPVNQTIPTPGSSRVTEETKVRQWLTYWGNYFIGFFTSANRLTGGTGFDGDNIADRAITGKHISANIIRATNPGSEISFGSTATTVLNLAILAPNALSDITLNAATSIELGIVGDNLLNIQIDRSPDGLTWTNIVIAYDTLYCPASTLNFRWKRLAIADFVDVVPTAGTWFYRARLQHERNNVAIPAAISAGTVNLPNSRGSWFTAEMKNRRQ